METKPGTTEQDKRSLRAGCGLAADDLRLLQMGPIVRMRLYPVRDKRRVRTGWFTHTDLETDVMPWRLLEDEHLSDMPAMQRLTALGLYEITQRADNVAEYVQWTWRRTPAGDALLANLLPEPPTTGGA